MELAHLFIFLGILLIVAELFVGSFFLLPIGAAFFLTGIMAGAFEMGTLIYALAVINLIWVFALTRLWLARRRRVAGPPLRSGVEALLGQIGKVEEEINAQAGTGYVRVYGDSWRAKSVGDNGNTEVIAVGEWAEIIAVEGNHVRVRRSKK